MRLFQASHTSVLASLIVGLVMVLNVQPACAQKVALLPMADISKGTNGVNLAFTKTVETTLKQLGVEVLPMNEVMLFMARNKVRNYRYLDKYLLKKLGNELDCSLVLLGTVTEMGADTRSVGFSFTALDVTDGNPVWSESEATSVREQIRALGLQQPETVEELARPILDRVLAPLSEIATTEDISTSRDYRLLGMHLFPAYLQGGQEVEATLKIDFLGKRPTLIAAESASGKAYLQYDRRTDSYKGKWFAPLGDGSYPVDLRIEWGEERTVEVVESVASFEVINEPPGLEIEIKKATLVGQRLAFNDHILILPRIRDIRPMAGWALEIKTKEGDSMVYEEHEGDMPERMVWEGRGSDGFMLADGVYDITLHLWDLAGNHSTDTRRVALQAAAPTVQARITHVDGKASLNLAVEGHYEFPLVSWQAELRSITGDLLAEGKGRVLPATLEFVPPEGDSHVLVSISGEDLLGNRLRISRQKLPIIAVEKKAEEKKPESWVPDF